MKPATLKPLQPDLAIHPEVAEALAAGRPVVALESTLITHGFSSPDNLTVARRVEAAVRAAGAQPATIAVLKGQITVGLTDVQLESLAGAHATVRKCSRRDLPIVTSRGEDGATTVAATMLIAHMVGIRVLATGGIGGVHRGNPYDVSADLLELGHTPVTVVCAGAKAILDLPLTLEMLESHGVPVIGYGTHWLPAFYTRASQLPVNVRCDTPEEVAAIVRARDRLGLSASVLVTVPIPAEDELPAARLEEVIAQATAEARAQGIAGKDITPFLLSRIAHLTDYDSQRANVALLLNNARVAAAIAAALT